MIGWAIAHYQQLVSPNFEWTNANPAFWLAALLEDY